MARPDLVPAALLSMPVLGVGCAALTPLLGVWTLLLAALAFLGVVVAVAWSMGGDQ